MAKWKKDDDKEITLREFKSFVWNEYKYLKTCKRFTKTTIAVVFGCIRSDTYEDGWMEYAPGSTVLITLTNEAYPGWDPYKDSDKPRPRKWYTKAEIEAKATEVYNEYICDND